MPFTASYDLSCERPVGVSFHCLEKTEKCMSSWQAKKKKRKAEKNQGKEAEESQINIGHIAGLHFRCCPHFSPFYTVHPTTYTVSYDAPELPNTPFPELFYFSLSSQIK